ncbi:hypothetical protein E4U59_000359 [Claviceps monticola]|nr:hypothetical protein E4U59_000359 [Claviceps monticola]
MAGGRHPARGRLLAVPDEGDSRFDGPNVCDRGEARKRNVDKAPLMALMGCFPDLMTVFRPPTSHDTLVFPLTVSSLYDEQ